jgi:spermidine synthase
MDDTTWWYEADCNTRVRQGLLARRIHRRRSAHQEIEILEHDRLGRVLVLDGVIQTTQADEFIYHEMISHVPLLGRNAASAPDQNTSVLIIGGGDGGALREVLVHPWVSRVVIVEIDGEVVEVCRDHLGIHGDFTDPRVTLLIEDGFAFLLSAQRRGDPFDVILVDSTDPLDGPSKTLFTADFIDAVAACLKPNGVVVRQFGLPFFEMAALGAGVAQMRAALGHCQVYRGAVPTYLGGDMAFALCSLGGEDCSRAKRTHRGKHYNPDIHGAAFALPSWWEENIGG